MAISPELLEILVCPACKGQLELKSDGAKPEAGSGLRCVACHRLYPVRDDIPIMLVSEASIDE